MAEKKQYPVKIDLNRVPTAPVRRGNVQRDGEPFARVQLEPPRPLTARELGFQVGNDFRQGAARGASTAIRAAENSSPATMAAANAIRALGSQDNRVAVREFLEGLGGQARRDVPQAAAKPAARAMTSATPAKAAPRRAGGDAAAPVSMQNQLLATILGSNLTVNEAATVAGLIPQAAKPASAKDTVLGQAAEMSKSILADQVAQVQQEQAAGRIDLKTARSAIGKATTEHFNRQAGLVGFNPMQLAQATLMGQAVEEE